MEFLSLFVHQSEFSMFPLSQLFFLGSAEWIPAFFNLYDKSRPENQTKLGEIDPFRKVLKVLVYVFCSKSIDFRAILRNTFGTPVDSGLSRDMFAGKEFRIRSGSSEFDPICPSVIAHTLDLGQRAHARRDAIHIKDWQDRAGL